MTVGLVTKSRLYDLTLLAIQCLLKSRSLNDVPASVRHDARELSQAGPILTVTSSAVAGSRATALRFHLSFFDVDCVILFVGISPAI
jgi:hypothetical protein